MLLLNSLFLLLTSSLVQAQLHLSKRTNSPGQVRLQPEQSVKSAAYSKGQYTATKQDETLCKSNGEQQWTGTVDVTDERRLFYWFFESRNDPANDPVIIWMNGGPGASSMMGLFTEMGPCILTLDSNDTYVNEFSWNNKASVLFLEQPAGVGFSSLAPGAPLPSSDLDGAPDFETFLNIFFTKAFPQYAKNPLHITGESYGGHYVPTYVNYILESRKRNSRDAFLGDISSIILVDALISFPPTFIGSYELLCNPQKQVYNSSICAEMASYLPQCMKLWQHCESSQDPELCGRGMDYCAGNVGRHYEMEIEQGIRNPYNIHKGVPDTTIGDHELYLNRSSVMEKLGLPSDFTFAELNWGVNQAYSDGLDPYKPTAELLANILDSKEDISVLVLNGNDDWVANTYGQIMNYEQLGWQGLAAYRVAEWKDYYTSSKTDERAGFWKQSPEAHLVFVGIDDAGHTCPGDQREVAATVLEEWFSGWKTGLQTRRL